MAAKKDSSKKNKGPKGKKARAKAKLDRQWGEVVDETKQVESRIRRGKSRLNQKDTRKGPRPQKVDDTRDKSWNKDHGHDQAAIINYDDDDDSSQESGSDDDVKEGALTQLLQSITKKSQITKNKQNVERKTTVEDSDNENESEMEIENSDLDHESSESEGSEIDVDDGDNTSPVNDEENMIQSTIDPFSSHFHKELLPDDKKSLQTLLDASQKFVKAPSPFLDSSLHLQLSGVIADALESSGALSPELTCLSVQRKWQDMAHSFYKCNRKVLQEGWKETNKASLRKNPDSQSRANSKGQQLSSLQSSLYPSLATYSDALVTVESRQNRECLHDMLQLHVLNHVLTSRGRIQRNNKKAKELLEATEGADEIDEETLRDQGFTRPTVLILLPTRGTCHSFLDRMLKIISDVAQVENLDRFNAEYGPLPIDINDTETDEEKRRRRQSVLESKGPDWQEIFGDQENDDDDFKVGVALSTKMVGGKKQKNKVEGGISVKLYADFYRSDIIIASPLGLKMSLGGPDGEEDVDFLSSIEVCLVAHSDVLLMQNWDHVNSVLDILNQQPTKNNDTDFSRVRNYHLADQAQYWRQLIICSKFCDPNILSTFKRYAKSIAGQCKLKRRTATEDSSLCDVIVRAKQIFQRVPCSYISNQGNDRLRYFEERILPQMLRLKQKHVMMYIPSYFDFVSVRNLLLKREVEFVSVTEYARVSEVSRGRARFQQGLKPLMLYTGRAHFFKRHTIKGVRHLIFYGVPEHSEFYSGIVNVLNLGLEGAEGEDMDAPTSCLALFTKYDAHALERIVGSQHCERMMKGEKSTYMFCS